MADSKGAIPLSGGEEPIELKSLEGEVVPYGGGGVQASMLSLIDARVRKQLKQRYMGVEMIAFDANHGQWIQPNGTVLVGWLGLFTARGVLIGEGNYITQPHIWLTVPTDADVTTAINAAVESIRNALVQQRTQIMQSQNGQGGTPQ